MPRADPKRFQREGRTILLVTHAADLVRQICDRAAVLDHGDMVMVGEPADAVLAFRDTLLKRGIEIPEEARGPAWRNTLAVRITGADIDYPDPEREHLLPSERLRIRMQFEAPEPLDDVVFALNIHDQDGNLMVGTNTDVLGADLETVAGSGEVVFDLGRVPLLDGIYDVAFGVHDKSGGIEYDHREGDDRFQVLNPTRTVGRVDFAPQAEVHLDRARAVVQPRAGLTERRIRARVRQRATGKVMAHGGAPDYGSPSFSFDIARDIAVMPDGQGYAVLDGWGGVHLFGSAFYKLANLPIAYWPGWDIANSIAISPSGRGFAVLDGWGTVHAGATRLPSRPRTGRDGTSPARSRSAPTARVSRCSTGGAVCTPVARPSAAARAATGGDGTSRATRSSRRPTAGTPCSTVWVASTERATRRRLRCRPGARPSTSGRRCRGAAPVITG